MEDCDLAADVDVRDPDEKSIMTYVSQFLQYSRDMPATEEEMQATPERKAAEVTCWLSQAYDELLEGWHSTEGEAYSERYHVFQTFLVSFNEQRRPIMPLLTAMRRSPRLSEEQRALREAWDSLTEKLREYKMELDMSLPSPLDTVARWLLKTEGALSEDEGETLNHGRAADQAKDKQELLKVCLEEMPQQLKTFQSFHNTDEYLNTMVPADKLEELKRRFTGVRVSAKYHGIKLEYREHRHTVLDLLGQIRTKLRVWKRPYISPEAVRVLLQEWNELVNTQELPSLLEAALHKLKQISEKYSSKSALAADYHSVSQQVKELEENTALVLEEVTSSKSAMGRVLSAWDSYSDSLSSLQAWLLQSSLSHSHGREAEVTPESILEWGSRHAHLNEVSSVLVESTDPQTSKNLSEELRRVNTQWADFYKRHTFDSTAEPTADVQARPPDIQALIREATLILKEPLDTMAAPLRTYRKRIQFITSRIKEVDLDALAPSTECPADQLQKIKLAIPEVTETLFEAQQVCAELQHSVSGLDSRLAELLHWETEAREMYQLLRAAERQKQQGQDPRARALISRGLQLEGQVVTEEQDLQVLVMKNQKNSPIQYLHASAMQVRVRATVAQSQEAVGMLSSLGARRDRSRSPPEGSPPSKVFIEAQAKPQHLRQSPTKQQGTQQQPQTKSVTSPRQETFVPKIVVQEYKEQKTPSPPMPYSYAQAVTGTRTPSPPQTTSQIQQQQTHKQGMTIQQEQVTRRTETELRREEFTKQPQEVQKQVVMQGKPQQRQQKKEQGMTIQQEQVTRRTETELRREEFTKQPQEVQGKPQKRQQEHRQEVVEQRQQVEMHQQHMVTHVQVETQVRQTTEPYELTSPAKKPHLSSQELQSRKAQAMKNRPWLKEPTSGEHRTLSPDPERDSTPEPPMQIGQQTHTQSVEKTVRSVQAVSQDTATAKQHSEAHVKVTETPRQPQKEQQRQTQQTQNLEQQQQQRQQQQQQKQSRQQEQLLQQQKQQPPQPVRQAQPDSDTKPKSQTVSMAQPHPQTKAQSQSYSQTVVQSKYQGQVKTTSMSQTTTDGQQISKTMSETRVSQDMSKAQVPPQQLGPMKIQTVTQQQTQAHLQPSDCVPAGPLGLPHGPVLAQFRATSPMQGSLQGPIQPPMPSHVQLRSHAQSWAPVRSPSPRQPAYAHAQADIHAQPMAQSQSYPQSMQQQSQTHPQTIPQSQIHQQSSMQQSKTQTQSMSHTQTHLQQSQIHHQTMPQTQIHAQSMPQSQIHAKPTPHPLAQPSTQQTLVHPSAPHQVHSQPMAQYPTHAQQPPVQLPGGHVSQGQIHTWTQVRASSPMAIPHPQAMQPQHPPQGYSPSQQWTPQQEPQNQGISQQRHPSPQPYPQPMGQSPTSPPYPALQQWPQTGPGPQIIRPPGYSQMGPSYPHPQPQTHTQAWVQSQPQVCIRQQQPQMRGYDIIQIQTQQGQVQQQQTWVQGPPQAHPYPQPQPQSQQYSQQVQHQYQTQRQPQIPGQIQTIEPPYQAPLPHYPSQSQTQTHQTHIQTQPPVQVKAQAQSERPQFNIPFQQMPPEPKPQAQIQPQKKVQSPTVESLPQPKPLAPQQEVQSPTQPILQSPTKPKVELPPQPVHEPQLPTQPKAQSLIKAESPPQLKSQVQTAPPPEALPTQPKAQSLPPQPQPQPLQAQSDPLHKPQTAPQSMAQSPPQVRPTPLESKPPPSSPPQPKPQQPRAIVLPTVIVLPESPADSPDLCIIPPALAQAPPQAYTEAYNKAQALARNGFEEAKHCLQEHIMETINVFKDKSISAEQAAVKKNLDPELLEEFLRAAKGMEAFCTPSQLTDMEFYTQSVRTQWEAVRQEISGFLPQLRFEVKRKDFNTAALQCERHISAQLENQAQTCVSADGSFAQAGLHLEAMKELCDTLSPEDAHRLAKTQLRECETRLAAIQRQFSGDQDAPLPDSRIPVAFSEGTSTTQPEPTKPSDKPLVSAEVIQVTMQTVSVERKEFEKQPSVEEEVTRKDALERYESCKRTLQAQLAKNEQSIKDVPSDSVSLKGLHTRLQEIQFLRQESESLWSEYATQSSQCSQLNGNTGLEQEKTELQEQWRRQQSNLQRKGSSLGAALRQIDSTENHMVDFTDRLDRYLRQPKDISAFTLANSNMLKDIKELDDNIQNELDQLSRLDPESSDLDPRDCLPLSREVDTHKTSLDQLRQQVRKSEAAARALDRFLMSLRTVDEDISGVQGAPCSDPQVLQDCRAKLAVIRQSIDSLKEKAPQLDVLLQGARLTVTRDGVPASCLDMVTALLRRLEEADSGLAGQQKGLKTETQSRSLGLRKRTLLGDIRKLQETIEAQGLKEPTMPAVQHRLRALSDLEGQMQTQPAEIKILEELQETQGGGEEMFEELQTQWKDTQRAFSEGKTQCNVLLDLLKKFGSCRGQLSSTMRGAEQTIGDQASYMGKDNLQRSITKGRDIKAELSGLGGCMEEMRGVCRQLQTQLKKFPECSEAPFESEADTLMDNWLDVTEKTDAYLDNQCVGLEVWEKQLLLGGEVDAWAGSKLALFAESHPFNTQQQVLDMRDEIVANEENIERFHKKSEEIQKMLQGQEPPLELQVMETQLRKRMQQVKELFTDCTDVFEELISVKTHLAEKLEECQSAVENIQAALSKVDASQPKAEDQIQDLVDDLGSQEEEADAVLREVGLVSSVASPQVLEALTEDGHRLKEAIARTRDMIHLKREERDKGLLKVITDERQAFQGWFQDLQVSVNECFENPESRTDVETSLNRLTSFLKSKAAEKRLEQLKAQLERGSQQAPPTTLSELTDWLREQQAEVGTFSTHCLNRQKQMEALLTDLNSLQKQHDSFSDWLQSKEKQSVDSDKIKLLLKVLQDESGKTDSLGELLASVRRQGIRAEGLLKRGDNLIQRYRSLVARLQAQADAHNAMQGECDKFNTEAEGTRTWITELLKPLTSSTGRDTQKAQAILRCKSEGDSKIYDLREHSERLCYNDNLETSNKEQLQASLRETEEQWSAALQTAEQALDRAQTQAHLDQDSEDFKTQCENVQSWIKDQEQNLKSLGGCMQVQEKIQIAKDTLSSKPDGDSKIQDLKHRCQSLCNNQDLNESSRRELNTALTHTEEQWRTVLKEAEKALSKTETEAETEREVEALKSQSESIQSWVKELKQKLLSSGGHTVEERLQVAQTVLTSKPEGDSKVLLLKRTAENMSEHLDESSRPLTQQLVSDTEQQWRAVLQAASQAELRGLSDDFDTQSKNTQSWVRDRQQKLQYVGAHTPPTERSNTAQSVLSSKPEGDCKVNNLRRRGQSVCDHGDADQSRKSHVEQTVRDTEEQWRAVLQNAKQAEAAAGAQITMGTERREMEMKEFGSYQQDIGSWLTELTQQVEALKSQTKAEDRLHSAQTIINSKPEGDSKVQELRRRCQRLCGQDIEEHKKQELQQTVSGAEEKWTQVIHSSRQAVEQAERGCTLELQIRDYETLTENTRAWLQEKQQSLGSTDAQTDAERAINTAQTILSCKPEGDSKLTELRLRSQSLSDQADLEENRKISTQQTVKDLEQQWTKLLQSGENTLKKAQLQCSLSRELDAFHTQAASTQSWVKDLQKQAGSKGSGTQGSQAQIEERLNTAQVILSSKSLGECKVSELKRRAESLCESKGLEQRSVVEQTLRDTEQLWRNVLKDSEDTQSQLKGVVDRLVTCRAQRSQTESRLSELQKQSSSLPRLFPWPGLGERREAVEQARTLRDHSTALAPVLKDLRKQSAEMFEITKDSSWSDPSWTKKEESIPAMLKDLTSAIGELEQGIRTERQCTQLVEQHEAAQAWLREHVKGLGDPPADRQGLQSAVSTLKALLQTVAREQREMKDLDSSRDSLLSLCTPGGKDALTLEISHLHQLCSTSEQEVRARLSGCEKRLVELDSQQAKRAGGLKERAAALQWELRSLDQALSYSEPQNNITQLQQHWHSLQNCDMSLQDLGVKVHDLNKEVKALPATELPTEIITMVESLCQQNDSLKSRMSEHQGTCSTNTTRYVMDCLHGLQEWNQQKPSESISSLKESFEEGEKLQVGLREALSQKTFLTDCLMPVLFEKLEKDGSATLREAETHKASLSQSLKELGEKRKKKLPDVPRGNQEETKTPIVAPPRKNKRSPEKKIIQLPEAEAKALRSTETAVMEDTKLTVEITETKSQYKSMMCALATAQSFTTSEEAQFRSTELVITTEPVEADKMKPAVPEPVLIQKVTEHVLESLQIKPTIVPPRRKTKNGDNSTTSETVTHVISPDAKPEQIKKEVSDDRKSSIPDVVTESTQSTVVELGKLSPTKRKSKGLKLSPEPTTTETTKTVEGPDSQKPSSAPEKATATTVTTAVEKGKVSTTKELPKTKMESDSQKPSSTSEVVTVKTEIRETTVVEKGQVSPTKVMPKVLELSPTLAKTKEVSGSQKVSSTSEVVRTTTEITETTVVEKEKVSPTERKSKGRKPSPEQTKTKEELDTQKPSSTTQVVTANTEMTETAVVEKGQVSPTKRTDQKTSLEQIKIQPDSQKPSSTSEVVRTTTEITETTVVEKEKASPTERKSKGRKPSPEQTKTKEELDTQKPSSTTQVVTAKTEMTETTVVEKGQVSPTKVMPKVLELSPTLAKTKEVSGSQKVTSTSEVVTVSSEITKTTVEDKDMVSPTERKSKGRKSSPEQTKTKEELASQKPSSTTQVVTAKTEITGTTVMEKGQVSPTKGKSTVIEISSELQKTKETPDSQKPSSTTQVVMAKTEITTSTVLEKGQVTPTKRKDRKLSPELPKAKEVSDSQKPSPTQEVVTAKTEITVVSLTKELPKTKVEPESQKMSSTSEAVTATTTVEGKEPVSPTKRRSKGRKPSPEQTKKDPGAVIPTSTQDVVTAKMEIAETTVVEKGQVSPTKGKSMVIEPPTKPTKTKEGPITQKSSSTAEVLTTTTTEITETTDLGKDTVSPSKRKSKDRKSSPEHTKTKVELDSQKPSSTPAVVTATTASSVVEKGKVSPTKGQSTVPELSRELPKTKEEPESKKPASTQEVVTTTTKITETTVVEKGQVSPTKRKPKGLKLSEDLGTTEVIKTKEEAGTQKPTSPVLVVTTTTTTKSTVVSPTKAEPMVLELSQELLKTQEEPQSQKVSSTPEAVSESTETSAVKENRIYPTKRRYKGPKSTLEQSTKEVTDTKQEPVTQKALLSSIVHPGSYVEETKKIATIILDVSDPFMPTHRMLKGPDVSTVSEAISPLGKMTGVEPKETEQNSGNRPKTQEFQVQAETAVVEQSKVQPPKRKSKGAELPVQLADTKAPQPKGEPDGQTYSLSSNVQIKSVVIEETNIVPPRRKSKSGDFSATSETSVTHVISPDVKPEQIKKDVDQKPSTTDGVKGSTKTIVVEKDKLTPTERKSKGQKLSQELTTTESTKTKEGPDSQKPFSTTEAVTTTTTEIEKTAEIQKRYLVLDVPEKGVTQTCEMKPGAMAERDSTQFTSDMHPQRTETEFSLISSSKQEIIKPSGTVSQQKLSETTQDRPKEDKEHGVKVEHGKVLTLGVADSPKSLDGKFVEKIPLGSEVRILQLDVQTSQEGGNTSVPSSKRIDTVQTSIQKVPENKDMTPADVKPKKAAVKMTTIEMREGSSAQPSPASEALIQDKAWTEFVDVRVSKQDQVKPSQTGQLNVTETQIKFIKTTQEKPTGFLEIVVQDQRPTLSTAGMDVAPKTLDEKSVIIKQIHTGPEVRIVQLGMPPSLKESSIDSQDKVALRDSVQPISSASKSLQPNETEFIEIGLYDQDVVKPSTTEMGLLKIAQAMPTEVKEQGVQEGAPKVSSQGVNITDKCIDEKSVRMEKIHMKPEVHVFQIDKPTTLDESITFIKLSKDSMVDIVQTGEMAAKTEDETTPDVKPRKATVKTRVEVQEISAEKVSQSDSSQPTAVASTTVQPSEAGTTLAEISLSLQDTAKPSQTMVTLEGMKLIQEKPQKEQEITSVVIAKAPKIGEVQASVQSETVIDKLLARHYSEAMTPDQRHALRTSCESQDISKPSQSVTQQELLKTTEERQQEVKDRDVPASLEEKSVKKGETSMKVHEYKTVSMKVHEFKTVTTEKEPSMESSVRVETLQEIKDGTAIDKSAVKMTRVEVRESFTESLSESSVIPGAQTEVKTTDAKDNNKAEQKEDVKKTIQEEEKKNIFKVEIQSVPVYKTEEMRPQSTDSTQVNKDDKSSPVLLQAVVKSSSDIMMGGGVMVAEGFPSQENKSQAEAVAVTTEKLVLEEPEGSAMRKIFTEIQQQAETGPDSQLIEGKPEEDAPEALMTSTADLENRLSRLVSKVLSCKNLPAELNPTAMAQQLEEAQECKEAAEAQVLLLSQLRESDAKNSDALELVEDQWTAAVQDTTAVIQSKEAQLQVLTDYSRQAQEATTTLEKLTTELDAVRMSPEESSSKEAERLSSLQISMEENRTVLGKLLVTHVKLCPHLSRLQRATAQTEQNNLQNKWRGLERSAERTLYHTKVHSQVTTGLLSAISGVQEHLETLGKDLEAKSPSVSQWNCSKAQQLMEANAKVKAAQQEYLHLQQMSEAVLLSSRWEKETKEIQQGLQKVKDQLGRTEEIVSSQTQNSSNPIMEKIIVVMRDGLAWAKQTESDIEGRRKRVALMPEEVHRQLRDLKKMQSEVMAKQVQLESLVEEVTEFIPQLDQAEEVPMVRTSLESLEELSKSTTEKLAKAVRETESGLQTREKLSEQIADLESWFVAHLLREASRSLDEELRSPTELDRRVRQIQETIGEAEKQAAVCEVLLMKSKDMAPELSITENCQLFDKLTDFQEDIKAISSYEKANKKELDELTQTVDSSKKNVDIIEKRLRQMLLDLSRHRYPITIETVLALEPYKHMILEHKSQLDLLQPWIPQEKTRELHAVISELCSKMVTLDLKAKDQERYLNMRQCVEDLRENVKEQVPLTKEDSRALEEKYKLCQTLLAKFPLTKYLTQEANYNLQIISADLYPSQLRVEQERLKQNEESLDILEMTLNNNLSIIERDVLKDLDLDMEREASQAFLWKTKQELQKPSVLEPNDAAIDSEYRRIMSLKNMVESRMRALQVLEQKKGSKEDRQFQDLMDKKKAVLSECDSKMENISQARKSLRGYTFAVRQAVGFLREIEVSLQPPQGSAGLCSERLDETQQALASLQQQFQVHVEKLQTQVALHPYLCPQKVEQLQENILSQLLVRMSTLQAKGHVQLEGLSRCAENHRRFSRSQDEIMQNVKRTENILLQVIRQKVTCLSDCIDQQDKLCSLSKEVESLQRLLDDLSEWCSEQSCRGGREAAVTAVWKRVSRLRRCTTQMTTRTKQRIEQWAEITSSVEKASVVLDQVQMELPDGSHVRGSTEELTDLLQTWEQYQDRLDCEHRALSALELRSARMLGVPAHLEQAPSVPLCQQLQLMQAQYNSVAHSSREGLESARLELEEREKLREDLHGVKVWLDAADVLLSEMERSNSTQELQEVHSQLFTQKALHQRVMETLKIKYSDTSSVVPVEIEAALKDVTQSLQQVEVKVGKVVERSGPVHQLGVKLSEVQAGLRSVSKRLQQRSPNVNQAQKTQKRVWDELDVWHSCVAALEVSVQDLEKPEDILMLSEKLTEVQQLHSQLAKQAEQRTALLSKIHTWLQEHQEMINSSRVWITEARSWLAAPCTYTTAKDLSNHVQHLKTVLEDSCQIRSTLQDFSSVLDEMSPVCDVTSLQEQLDEADRQVADAKDSFTAPLSQLEHSAAEVEAIESEVRRMENDMTDIKTLLLSPETFPSPKEESFKVVEKRIQSMRTTVTEILRCKPDLCLPDNAEDTLTVFSVVGGLQALLLELEKKVPALFIQQPLSPGQDQTSQPQLPQSTEETEKADTEGLIRIAHVEEDVLRRSGASLMTVEHSSPEQRETWTPERTTESQVSGAEAGQSPEPTGEATQDVLGPTDTATEASSSEALSKPLATVKTQSMVNTASSSATAFRTDRAKCLLS